MQGLFAVWTENREGTCRCKWCSGLEAHRPWRAPSTCGGRRPARLAAGDLPKQARMGGALGRGGAGAH